MIKGIGSGPDGKPIVFLGLTEQNLQFLRQDMPVKVELSELGLPPTTIVIFTGPTEEAMIADLAKAGMAGPVIDKKTPRDNRAHG